ncbi:PqqD family protein [Desulfospira joergensenii]|uniref:PqqD family protein n=1 Tax=Desulfospira joergensenii TaxID=53329 RepID=UPI0003B397A9|nr:PqqD family protein [Desulfospira joergensenii]
MTRQDSLLCVPEKNSLVREKILESGDLVLSWPQEYRPFFLRVRRFLRKSAQKSFLRKIQLDLLGKDVWDLIDGKKNIRTIVKEFAQHHQVNPREAEISVTLFMKSLGEKGLIVIREA